jgi:hypothetical protein
MFYCILSIDCTSVFLLKLSDQIAGFQKKLIMDKLSMIEHNIKRLIWRDFIDDRFYDKSLIFQFPPEWNILYI